MACSIDPLVVGKVIGDVIDMFMPTVSMSVYYGPKRVTNGCELGPGTRVSEIKFDDNAVVLVNKQGEPIGTRVFGPIPHELRKKKHVKILTLAEHIA